MRLSSMLDRPTVSSEDTSTTHLDQLSASHHHLCSSCYHVDLHSSSLLRIDAHCDVVVSPHTDTHHSIVLLPVSSSPTHVFYSVRIALFIAFCSLRFARDVIQSTQPSGCCYTRTWSASGSYICWSASTRCSGDQGCSAKSSVCVHICIAIANKIYEARRKQYSWN